MSSRLRTLEFQHQLPFSFVSFEPCKREDAHHDMTMKKERTI